MAQLFYRYSTMNAGKSLELIKVAYNYEERGKRTLCIVPNVDKRYGKGMITSRIGLSREAIAIDDNINILKMFMEENLKEKIDCVLIDECQFLKKHHVEELVEIVDSCNTPVMAYGLKNDFRNELFEGSYYMLIYADKIEEIKTICWCGRKATMIARVVDGKFVKSGEQIMVGGNDMYVSLCRKHYNDGRIGEKLIVPNNKNGFDTEIDNSESIKEIEEIKEEKIRVVSKSDVERAMEIALGSAVNRGVKVSEILKEK